LWRCISPFQADDSSSNGTAGQVANISQIGKQVCMAGYYTFEMIVWLGSNRVLRFDKE